jgi:Tfp pilus assembly protein PilO
VSATSRGRVRLLIGLALAAPVLVVSQYSLPQYQDLQSQAQSKLAEAQQLDASAHAAEAVKLDQARYDKQQAAFQAAIPNTPRLADVLNSLQAAAKRTGVIWTAGTPAQGGGAAVPTWTVSMSLTGTATEISAFTDAVRAMPRLVVIDSVSMSGDKDSDVSSAITARFFALTDKETR